MTQQHPIIPPPELVRKWQQEANHNEAMFPQVADKAAQWGADQANADIERKLQEAADQELEACCEWIHGETSDECFVANLRAARRPKSEKQQALEDLDRLIALIPTEGAIAMAEPIRRALESIPTPCSDLL